MSPQDAERLYSDSAYSSVIVPLRRSYTNELTHGFLTATVNSGKLALIRDASLRAALAETESLDQDAAEIRAVLADLAQRGVLAMSRHVELAEAFTAEPGSDASVSRAGLRQLRSDPDVMQIVGAKVAFSAAYLTELDRLRTHLDSVIALTESE